MKRSDFCNISSYKELRVARSENYRALNRKKNDIVQHGVALAESLSPGALLGCFIQYISPLRSVYEFLCKWKK